MQMVRRPPMQRYESRARSASAFLLSQNARYDLSAPFRYAGHFDCIKERSKRQASADKDVSACLGISRADLDHVVLEARLALATAVSVMSSYSPRSILPESAG